MKKLTEMDLTDDEFLRMTRYCNAGDNQADNRRRAIALGFELPGISIAPGAIIRLNSAGFIEKNVFIGLYCYINGAVRIEENVLIGPGCALTAGQHKFDPKTNCFSARTESDGDESITIGCGAWLCAHVTITPGVKIGRANLICAGAVVTHSTSDYAIMAGIPARQVGHICPETGTYHWYNSKTQKHEDD